MYVEMNTAQYAKTFTCMYVCTYVCMYACMYVCLCLNLFTHLLPHPCIYRYTCTHATNTKNCTHSSCICLHTHSKEAICHKSEDTARVVIVLVLVWGPQGRVKTKILPTSSDPSFTISQSIAVAMYSCSCFWSAFQRQCVFSDQLAAMARNLKVGLRILPKCNAPEPMDNCTPKVEWRLQP